MKTFRKAAVIFLLFMVGTMSVVHVDRQCAAMERKPAALTEKLENFIEKQGYLL